MTRVELRIPARIYADLHSHLFSDGDEHGAVIAAGYAESGRSGRLLARELFIARDGVDYVPGRYGYRQLHPDFVQDRIGYSRDERLAYLAVHNHGGTVRVAFSGTDMESHERGYPALLDIGRGVPIGALVLAENALAGDIWFPDGRREPVASATVIGPRIVRLTPLPRRRPGWTPFDDRQARLLGPEGRSILNSLKVGIVGAGGVGMLLVEYLSRLGVGHLVVADPERVQITNLPRLVGASRWDARYPFCDPRMPLPVRAIAERFAAPKVRIARRIARQANPPGRIEAIFGDLLEQEVAAHFTDCDYLFLAADPASVRLVFNALVQQYLIPGVQIGAKATTNAASGELTDVFSVVRPITPGEGCLFCNDLIPPARLAEEAATRGERRGMRYVDEPGVVAPSVITLNATAAAHAANDFLFAVTGLTQPKARRDYLRIRPLEREVWWDGVRRAPGCPECGNDVGSRRARGDGLRLPTRIRSD